MHQATGISELVRRLFLNTFLDSMATIEEEYVEGEDFDEEDEDAYEYEEEDGEVEDGGASLLILY